ncbi:TolC family protein [Fulvivirga sp. M361]|uniref:TolC family protein n=1 Tax=Fulvivirga sp. M361 TaxID=2594266 RepID=UPI00117B68F3|nr:TolC family protein [Fulvivirga sp. M361]TRX56069.1 TolC family protein [Fulvivirga sp. M361]
MNKNFLCLITLLLFSVVKGYTQQNDRLTMGQVINMARDQSPFSKRAETAKENSYWEYRRFKSDFNPQLRLVGQGPEYNNAFVRTPQPDGSIRFQPVDQINPRLSLELEQPLPWTGGQISVNSNLSYFEQFGGNSSTLWRGSPFNIFLSQPLFAFNPLKWDKKTEPLRYEESKREYVEEVESISREAARRFFDYLDAQINLQIADFNLANNDTIYRIEQGRYNIGTTSRDKLLQVELQLLRSEQAVAQAKLDLETSGLRLRSYIGFNDEQIPRLALPEDIPEFEVNYGEALDYAQRYRSDYLAFQRRKLEAERDVAQARGQIFETTLTATFGLNDSGSDAIDVYSTPQNEQRFNLGFAIPLVTWGRNEARMKSALANQRLQDYTIAQDEQNFEQEILTQVRQFEMLRTQLKISKKSDEVARERYEVAQNRYLIGKIDITNLNIALNEKDEAKRSYISALRDFWTAYYQLRELTLYDFNEKRLLYTPDE